MSSHVSDMKWSEILKEMCGLEGGARWYTNFVTMSSKNEYIDAVWKSASCSDFDESIYYSDTGNPGALTYDIEVCEFPNNVKLVLSLFYTAATNPHSVIGYTRFKYNGQYTNVPNGFINGFSSAGNICTPAVLKSYGVKYALITDYTGLNVQTAGGVVEDVTSADYVAVLVCMPFTNGEVIQSWLHVHDGTMTLENAEFPEAGYTLPDGFYYPNIFGTPAFVSATCRYTDFDDIVDDVKDINPSIPFTKDDIIKTGKPDPTQEDDPSTPGGGGGKYDDTSDPIDFPGLPTGGAISTGSIKSFLVDVTRVQALFRRLWNSSLFDIVTWQKIIEEPLNALVSLTCIPCTPTTGDGAHIQLGNIDTEVVAPVITNQYVTIDCGTLKVQEYWGSALDYSPYTKIDCWFPGIGFRPLKPEDIIGQDLQIKYNMDILTGNLTAQLKCGQSVLYKFQGNMLATVPITSRVFDALESLMKGAGSVASSYATGAMTASSREGATAETIDRSAQTAAAGAAISSAINVAMSKVQIQRSGDVSGSTGLLDDFTPYLVIHRPKQSLASNFKQEKGYPSNISATLGTLAGYTEVEYIHLTGITGATDAELKEIESLLKSGVII